MTSPTSEPTSSTSQPKAESFLDWFHINSRLISIGAGIVVVAAGVFWFVQRTRYNETVNSDRQLMVAKQSLGSGNEQLALADLKKVVDKYGDKPAGAEAGMIMASTQMSKGDFKAAVATLKDLAGKQSSGPNAASIRGLLGDALSQSGQPAEAAAEYDRAAALTAMTLEKATYQSQAARAYATAGKTAEARKLYEALGNQSDFAALQTEARVRLGELSVGVKP